MLHMGDDFSRQEDIESMPEMSKDEQTTRMRLARTSQICDIINIKQETLTLQ